MKIPIYELKYNKHRLPCLDEVNYVECEKEFGNSSDYVNVFEKAFDASNLVEEISMMLCFDIKHKPIGLFKMQKGTQCKVDMTPSVIIKRLVLIEASSFILAHNHPVGNEERFNTTPSQSDITATILLKAIGTQLLCSLDDHLIISNGKYRSVLDIINNMDDEMHDCFEYTPSALEVVEEFLRRAYEDAGYNGYY